MSLSNNAFSLTFSRLYVHYRVVLKAFASGIGMGMAEVLPGVSGSTIALMLGVYAGFIDFLAHLSAFAVNFVKFIARRVDKKRLIESFHAIPFKFGFALFGGMASGIVLFSFLVLYVLEQYPHYLYAVLTGLILAVLVIPYKEIKSYPVTNLMIFIVSFIGLFLLLGLSGENRAVTDPSYLMLYFAGIVAICAMLLPGVSGSFTLLVLGLYYYVIDGLRQVLTFDASVATLISLAVFAAGVISGFLLSSRTLRHAIKFYPDQFLAFIAGLLLASMRVLVPFVASRSTGDDLEIIYVGMDSFLPIEIAFIACIVVSVAGFFGWLNYRYITLSEK